MPGVWVRELNLLGQKVDWSTHSVQCRNALVSL